MSKNHTQVSPLGMKEETDCQTILSIMPQAIYTCDANGYIQMFNAAAVELWGREPVRGKDLWCGSWKIFNPDGSVLALESCPMAMTLKEKRKVFGHEIIIERPDGTRKNVLPYPQPLFDEDGSLTGAVNLLVDITTTRELETHRDNFIAIASHELKTPLTSLKLYLDLVNDILEQDAVKPLITKIVDQTNKIETLISDLLDMSKTDAGNRYINPVAIEIIQLLHTVTERLRHHYKSHAIIITGCPESCYVLADKQRIEQVLENLISNAIKYSPQSDSIHIQAEKKGDVIQIEIADTGLGIPPAELPKIFDRYYRVANTGFRLTGLGMGLYISKDIIEKHGGKIWVESTFGQGSKFYFTLPSGED